jgi:hypothetical protein
MMRCSFLFAVLKVLVALFVKPTVGQSGVFARASDVAEELASLILNPAVSGVTITGAKLFGNAAQHGVYAQIGDLFKGLPSIGSILSSGRVEEVKGDNDTPNTEFAGSFGDDDLDAVLKPIDQFKQGYSTLDAAALQIQMEVSRPVTITVAYVFGSVDFVSAGPSTAQPDVFGLFLNNKNLAIIQGKPVSTATIYCDFDERGSCDQLITNFPNQVGTSLLGYTKTQLATLDLPKGTHQLKVAIADGTDNTGPSRFLDAAIFLSFVGAVQAPTAAPVSPPVPVKAPTAAPVSLPVPVLIPVNMKMTTMKMMMSMMMA